MKKKIKVIILFSSVILVILTVLLVCNIKPILKTFVESVVQDMEKRHLGEIVMPNDYVVGKIHAGYSVITHQIGDILTIQGNIEEVGWNNEIIVYKRNSGNIIEYGYINMKENKVYVVNKDRLIEMLSELTSEDKIIMKKVEELYPETRGY